MGLEHCKEYKVEAKPVNPKMLLRETVKQVGVGLSLKQTT